MVEAVATIGGTMMITDIPIATMEGTTTSLGDYAAKVVLVVNVASRCGLTPQYAKLEALQRTYADRGFTVLGFPSNQFLQELSSNEAIKEFCSTTYAVTFPVFDRVRVNGRHEHPLYTELKKTKDASGKAGRISGTSRSSSSCPRARCSGSVRRPSRTIHRSSTRLRRTCLSKRSLACYPRPPGCCPSADLGRPAAFSVMPRASAPTFVGH